MQKLCAEASSFPLLAVSEVHNTTAEAVSAPVRTWLAQPHEAPTVARLLIEFRNWWGREWPPDDLFTAGVGRLLADPQTELILAAAADGQAVGICQLRYRYCVWLNADDCWLEDLYVSESARRQGLGEALMIAALERARARSCLRVELDANESNQIALRLYERLGFSAYANTPQGRDLLLQYRFAHGR